MSKESTIRQLKHVRMICCGDYHSACLVEPGCVYTWGRGLVLGRDSHDPPPSASSSPMRRGSMASVTSQSSYQQESISGGRGRAVSMQFGGGDSSYNNNNATAGILEGDSSQPEMVSYFNRRRVNHICSGESHILARAGSELVAWGDNKHGQVATCLCLYLQIPQFNSLLYFLLLLCCS